MISDPAPENLSEIYKARGFIALYRISPAEIAEMDNPGILHAEPVSPREQDGMYRDSDPAQHDSNQSA